MLRNIILYIVLIVIFINVQSQEAFNNSITVNYTDRTIEEILSDISTEYFVDFYYNASIPDLKKRVSITTKNNSLDLFLEELFKNTSLVYRIDGNKVLLTSTSAKNIKTVIHGYVTDSGSKETLIGANIIVVNANTGTTSNSFGFYSITLEKVPELVTFSFIGYNDTTVEIFSTGDIGMNIALTSTTVEMEEVTITSEISSVAKSQTGYKKLTMNEVKMLPAFMGENDVLRTMQLTPGIKSGNEASSGFYVRGGGPDQNLVLLDGATLYNTSHSMNLFSVFNPDAIKDVEINKSGFPARYGGRLSSVIDVKMRDGNMEKYDGEIAIGYLTSKFTFEGPVNKGKTSFIITGRRSFLDLFTRWNMPVAEDTTVKTSLVFFDISAKINHIFSDRDRIFFSLYGSGDGFNVQEKADNPELRYSSVTGAVINWGNYNASFRWNHVYSGKLFSNTMLTYSRFKLFVNTDSYLDFSDASITDYNYSKLFGSIVEDYSLRTDFDYFPSSHHTIKYGIATQIHQYQPGISSFTLSYESVSFDTTFKSRYKSNDFFVYAEDDMEITKKLKANLGIHFSLLKAGNKTYPSIQPRVSFRYIIAPSQSLKASYSYMSQYIHLLTSAGQFLPLDLWVPATEIVPPMNAHQYNIGYVLEFFQRKYEFTAEAYYKNMDHLIEYREGVNFTNTSIPWYEKIYTDGKGKSYGIELFLQKKTGCLTGWVGYTLSKTDRSFDYIKNGSSFPYKFDKRNDLSVVAMYNVNKHINISGSWIYSTGAAFTFPVGTYSEAPGFFYPSADAESGSIQFFSGRNSVRMPDYHRLDLGINFIKEKKRGIRTWNISVYNVYARQNPFYIFATADNNGHRKLKQVYMYSILPSFTYIFKFN